MKVVGNSSPLSAHVLTAGIRLPGDNAVDATVTAGASIAHSTADGVDAWLLGLPFFTDPWLNAANFAQRWSEDQPRVLDTIDGTFLLLVVTRDNFFLVNDKVSPLTWHWTPRGDRVIASSNLIGLRDAANLPLDVDYETLRRQIFTRSQFFDRCILKGVRKIRKGFLVDRAQTERQYYDLVANIRHGSTPADYFAHLDDFVQQTMTGRKVATLASAGFDSRINCLMLNRHLDEVDVFTYRSDLYSEHRKAKQFLSCLPRQRYRLHTLGHSMLPGSPHYTPRTVYRHRDTYLECFDDLTMNKEHFIFVEALDAMRRNGTQVLVNGVSGDSVRRLRPLTLFWPTKDTLDDDSPPAVRELWGPPLGELEQQYTHTGNAERSDALRLSVGSGQFNYGSPLLANLGIVAVSLPICTARALELYRGIDRSELSGKRQCNLFSDYLDAHVPKARPVPPDTGIALGVPGEARQWIAQTIDLDAACDAMIDEGGLNADAIRLLRDTLGRQRNAGYSRPAFFNLWSWYCRFTGASQRFEASFAPLLASDAYLQEGRALNRSRARLAAAARRSWAHVTGVRDHRHIAHRAVREGRRALRLGACRAASGVYGVIKRCLGKSPSKAETARE